MVSYITQSITCNLRVSLSFINLSSLRNHIVKPKTNFHILFRFTSFFFIYLIRFFSNFQARIKAINTFFAKNGYRSMDSSMYTAQTQSQYNPNLYMQHVYSPQQQYPLYGIVPQTWTPSPTPYFETPLVNINTQYIIFMVLTVV